MHAVQKGRLALECEVCHALVGGHHKLLDYSVRNRAFIVGYYNLALFVDVYVRLFDVEVYRTRRLAPLFKL